VTTLSLCLPGRSALHRLAPRFKLAGLLVAETAVLVGVRSPLVAVLAVGVAAMLFAVARVPAGTAWRRLRTALAFALIVGVAQSFHLGARQSTVVAAQLLVCVALAVLVTLTTRTTDLLDVVEAW
jgi:biotin transport system permease protein